MFNVYFNGEYDVQALIGGLGKKYEILNLSFKPWPACAFAHPYIDAMLNLVSEHHLRGDQIERIEVFSGETNRDLCKPINVAKGQVPTTTNDAKRSVPFNVAVAALKGTVSFRDFTPEGLRDPEVLRMAEKVRWVAAPEFDEEQFSKKGNQLAPGKVGVTDRQGRTFTKRTDFPYGHHFNPIKADDLIKKFRDCLAFSPRPIPAADVEHVIEAVLHLEEIPDIREIIRPLA